MAGARTIPRLVKGKAPSLLDTSLGNQVIDTCNAVRNMKVAPDGAGEVIVGERDITLDLSALSKLIQQVTSGSGSNGTGGSGPSTQTIVNALKAATITGQCNSDGSLSIQINFPGL